MFCLFLPRIWKLLLIRDKCKILSEKLGNDYPHVWYNWVFRLAKDGICCIPYTFWASQVALVVKNLPAHAWDVRTSGSIPVLGRSPGGRNGNPLQYSCLENATDRAAWQAIVDRLTNRHDWSNLAHIHILVLNSGTVL